MRHLRLPALLLAVAVLAAGPAAAQTYGVDENPIKEGEKALAAGSLEQATQQFERAVADGYQVDRAKLGLGRVAAWAGQPEEAERLFHEAIAARQQKEGKDYPEAHAELGLLLMRRRGRLQEAIQELDVALAGKSDLWPACYGRALLLVQEGKRPEALRLLKKGAGLEGVQEGEDRYHHGMAVYWLWEGDLDQAEREALLALHLNPNNPEYALTVGEVYQKRGTPALAIGAFEQAVAAPGAAPSPTTLEALGRLYEKVGRYNDARDAYLRAVDADSTFAPALKDLADLLQKAGQKELAARTYLRYVQLMGDDVDALLGLAQACLDASRFGQAVQAAQAALKVEPDNVQAKLLLGRAGLSLCCDAQLEAEGAAALEELLPGTELTADDLGALGLWQEKQGRLDDARATLQRAEALDPESPTTQYELGILEMKAGRPEEAIVRLQRAAELQPEDEQTRLNLAIAYFQARRLDEAIPGFRQALAQGPELASVRLLLAQALAVADSVSAAQQQYQLVLQGEPDNAKALRGLGFCQIRKAAYAAAEKTYRQATRAEPGDAEGWAGLGNALLGQSKFDPAQEAFDKALAIEPGNAAALKGRELLARARESAR